VLIVEEDVWIVEVGDGFELVGSQFFLELLELGLVLVVLAIHCLWLCLERGQGNRWEGDTLCEVEVDCGSNEADGRVGYQLHRRQRVLFKIGL
jgi:hypothetical protein